MDWRDFVRPTGPLDQIVKREIARRNEAARLDAVAREEAEVEALLAQTIEMPAITIAKVRAAVCRHFGVRLIDLVSQRRTKTVVLPRQIGMHLCRVHTLASYPIIGRSFGNRDHTTVLHADRKITALRKSDAYVTQHVKEIEDAIGVLPSE